MVAFTNKTQKELKAWITNTWKAFRAHKEIFQREVNDKLKIKILESCIHPLLTYGAET